MRLVDLDSSCQIEYKELELLLGWKVSFACNLAPLPLASLDRRFMNYRWLLIATTSTKSIKMWKSLRGLALKLPLLLRILLQRWCLAR